MVVTRKEAKAALAGASTQPQEGQAQPTALVGANTQPQAAQAQPSAFGAITQPQAEVIPTSSGAIPRPRAEVAPTSSSATTQPEESRPANGAMTQPQASTSQTTSRDASLQPQDSQTSIVSTSTPAQSEQSMELIGSTSTMFGQTIVTNASSRTRVLSQTSSCSSMPVADTEPEPLTATFVPDNTSWQREEDIFGLHLPSPTLMKEEKTQLVNPNDEGLVSVTNLSCEDMFTLPESISNHYPIRWQWQPEKLNTAMCVYHPSKVGVSFTKKWQTFYAAPTRFPKAAETRQGAMAQLKQQHLWSVAKKHEEFCSRAYVCSNTTMPGGNRDLNALQLPNGISKNNVCVLQRPLPVAYFRKQNGLVPMLFSAPRYCWQRKLETYKAVPLGEDYPSVFCAAKLHAPSYLTDATVESNIKIREWAKDFSMATNYMEYTTLNESCLKAPVSGFGPDQNIPNIWELRTTNLSGRVTLRKVTLQILQLVVSTNLPAIDVEEEPLKEFPHKYLWETPVKEPRILAVARSTIPFAHAFLLKTAAIIGYQNLELFQVAHKEFFSRYQTNKLRELLWYCICVHALIRNLVYEILDSLQAEFKNYPYIRLIKKYVGDQISTPLSLRPLMQFIATQEIHASTRAVRVIPYEENQFMPLAEGQALPIISIQELCITMIGIFHHHAICNFALVNVDSKAYNRHDRCYKLGVLELNEKLGNAYAWAATAGYIPGRSIELQRRQDWLLERKDMTPCTGRKMPTTIWVKLLAEQSELTADIASLIDPAEYDDWFGAKTPEFVRREQERLARELEHRPTIDTRHGTANAPLFGGPVADELDSSGDEYSNLAVISEGTKSKFSQSAWAKKPIGQEITGVVTEADVRRRIKLVDYHLGEKAFAHFALEVVDANHPGLDLMGEGIMCAPHVIYCQSQLLDQIQKTVDDYTAAVAACDQAYRYMCNPAFSLPEELKRFNKHLADLFSAVGCLRTIFREDTPLVRTEGAEEWAVQLKAPITRHWGGDDSPVSTRWEYWALSQQVGTNQWKDLANTPVVDMVIPYIPDEYHVLSQQYRYAMTKPGVLDAYYFAVLSEALLMKNQGLYDPGEPRWTCGTCGSDLRNMPHREFCWHLDPGEYGAMVAFRRARAHTRIEFQELLDKVNRDSQLETRRNLKALGKSQEELLKMAETDERLADLLEIAYPGTMQRILQARAEVEAVNVTVDPFDQPGQVGGPTETHQTKVQGKKGQAKAAEYRQPKTEQDTSTRRFNQSGRSKPTPREDQPCSSRSLEQADQSVKLGKRTYQQRQPTHGEDVKPNVSQEVVQPMVTPLRPPPSSIPRKYALSPAPSILNSIETRERYQNLQWGRSATQKYNENPGYETPYSSALNQRWGDNNPYLNAPNKNGGFNAPVRGRGGKQQQQVRFQRPPKASRSGSRTDSQASHQTDGSTAKKKKKHNRGNRGGCNRWYHSQPHKPHWPDEDPPGWEDNFI